MTAISNITWREVEELITHIATTIRRSEWKPKQVVAIGRGGMVPARLLADELKVKKMEYLPVSRYNKMKGGRIKVDMEDMTRIRNGALLVDDICDAGKTLLMVHNRLKLSHVRFAVLHRKPGSKFNPDYVGRLVENNTWLAYPWERKETPCI